MNRLLVILALLVGASARPKDSDAPLGVVQSPARDLRAPTGMKQLGKKVTAAAKAKVEAKRAQDRRRLSDDIGDDVWDTCTTLTNIEPDLCAWATFDDTFSGDTSTCEALCAARDSCWAIQYSTADGWCDGCHYEESCLSTDDISDTTGSASLKTRGCFDVASKPDDDDWWVDLTDDDDYCVDMVALSCPTVYDALITCYADNWDGTDDDDDGDDGDDGFDPCASGVGDTYGDCVTLLSTAFGFPQWFIDACTDE